jgi:hypothetical protein
MNTMRAHSIILKIADSKLYAPPLIFVRAKMGSGA